MLGLHEQEEAVRTEISRRMADFFTCPTSEARSRLIGAIDKYADCWMVTCWADLYGKPE